MAKNKEAAQEFENLILTYATLKYHRSTQRNAADLHVRAGAWQVEMVRAYLQLDVIQSKLHTVVTDFRCPPPNL